MGEDGSEREKAVTARIAEMADREGERVQLRGWIYNSRSSGKLHFLQVRDGTGIVQCVLFQGDVAPEVFERCHQLPQETAVVVRGRVRSDPRSPIGYELGVEDLEIVHRSEEYPISPTASPS